MEYDDPADGRELAERVRAFVDDEVVPLERELLGNRSVEMEELEALRAEARERGIYAPQVEEEYGGLGMDLRAALPSFEEAGRSLLGPAAIRVDAPDEGNMHTLEMFGSDDQKERWLRPLVAGDIVSAFAMTEPLQGAGSDPKMLSTTAERDGDEWVINGHKWWTSNGSMADLFLTMAQTDPDAHPYQGASIILVPREAEGLEIVRDVPHLGGEVTGSSHAEVRFDGVRVPEGNLLGAENAGFMISQQRLGPARLTHCMRFSGMAERALDVAKAYASEREAFGEPLADKQALRHRLADVETRLHGARTMIRHAAAALAEGEQARVEVSMSKMYTANVVNDVVDLAVQICGGNGIGKDLPLADFYENVRAFRIFDGADEVHRRVIARDAFEDVDTSEVEHVLRFER
jgi:acyl-CoA dehydrogenase